jgi:hypothetical protein
MAAMSDAWLRRKVHPSLGRRSTSLDHVLRHARLSDVEAEFEQLAMDARRTPQRIFRAHPPDQCAQICSDLWYVADVPLGANRSDLPYPRILTTRLMMRDRRSGCGPVARLPTGDPAD